MLTMKADCSREARPSRAIAALLLAALVSSGCVKFASELDTVEPAFSSEQTSLAPGQASSRDGAPDGEGSLLDPGAVLAPAGRDWSCASDQGAEAAADDTQAPLAYQLQLEHFITGQPLDGALVRACFRADVNCDAPLSETLVDGSGGAPQVVAYEGFNGYLEITVAGMLPYLVFFGPWSAPLLAALNDVPLRVLPEAALQALGSTANVPLDPAAGVVAVAALDCTGASAGGVRLELDRGAIPYAFVDDLPVINRDFTSAQGLAGFVNVQPGIVVVTGYREGASDPVGVESMLVRSGWVSSSFLLPAFSR